MSQLFHINKTKIFFAVFILFFFISRFSFALQIPSYPDGRVNDYARLLDSSSKSELESKLKVFEEATSTQLVVATFPSLDGESLEDFSIRLAEQWKIGQKGKDNGAILLIFKNDRKLRIEVGYGLEGALPDAISRRIIQNEIIPHFKNGNFKKGIFAGVDAMMLATKGEYKSSSKNESLSWTEFLLLILFMGIGGLGFFGVLAYKMFSGIGGNTIGTQRSRNYWNTWGTGRSGGGFGGFSGGGGSFGGGGSSGSW